MKQLIVALTVCFLLANSSFFQSVPAAESVGNAEERYEILNSKLQLLIESQQSFLRRFEELDNRVSALSRELSKTKDESTRSTVQYVTREELKKVVETLQEIDRKRESDKKLILESLSELKNIPAPAASTPKPSAEKKEDSERWVYTVGKDENVTAILSAYNEKMKTDGRAPITLQQVRKANPDINLDRVFIGQQIYIPIPPKRRP